LLTRLIAIPDGTPGSYGPPGKPVQPTPLVAKPEKKTDVKKATPKETSGSQGDELNDQIISQVCSCQNYDYVLVISNQTPSSPGLF